MCEHLFSGCARGIGGWEDGRCCGYWQLFGFDFVTIVCIIIIIAPLHVVVDDVLYSLSNLLDIIILVYIFHYPVYAICFLSLSIWVAYVGVGRCSSSSSMIV